MIRIRRISLVLAALLCAGALAACGSSSSGAQTVSPGSGSSSAPLSGHQTVIIKGFAFSPSSMIVKVGTKVTFKNEDSVTHTATTTGDKTINSGNLAKDQTYTITFTKAGTYAYICEIHQYMHGTITVT